MIQRKFKVYVKNDKGNVVKVEFGDPNMEIKRDDPEEERVFVQDTTATILAKNINKIWSCKFWEKR